jgi:hypothetical protein
VRRVAGKAPVSLSQAFYLRLRLLTSLANIPLGGPLSLYQLRRSTVVVPLE